MSRSDQNTAQLVFDEPIRPGTLGDIKLANTKDFVHTRAGYLVALTLGKLELVRFRVKGLGKGPVFAPKTMSNHAGNKWFDILFPWGTDVYERKQEGMFVLPFTAHGLLQVKPHIEVFGPKDAEGKLALWIGYQNGMGL